MHVSPFTDALPCLSRHASTSSEKESTFVRPPPGDAELREVLQKVQLGGLLLRQGSEPGTTSQAPAVGKDAAQSRSEPSSGKQHSDAKHHASSNIGLDAVADWAGVLSLGEQQRLAFAR